MHERRPKTRRVNLAPQLKLEADGAAIVLRGCRRCHAAHPRALKPVPVDTDHCWQCGAAVAPPEAQRDLAAEVAVDPITYALVTLCQRAARFFGKLARSIEP